jgi:hypothetical protein
MSGLQEVGHHRPSHFSEADESNGSHGVPLCFGRGVRRRKADFHQHSVYQRPTILQLQFIRSERCETGFDHVIGHLRQRSGLPFRREVDGKLP